MFIQRMAKLSTSRAFCFICDLELFLLLFSFEFSFFVGTDLLFAKLHRQEVQMKTVEIADFHTSSSEIRNYYVAICIIAAVIFNRSNVCTKICLGLGKD